MSKAIPLARFTLAFIIIAGGLSFIIGSLMGGGLGRSYDSMKGINDDPRSILVQAVLIESDVGGAPLASLPVPGSQMNDAAFAELMSEASSLRVTNAARVRTPAMLVQHAESGSISVKLGDRSFEAGVSPRVIKTKHGEVLRVALQIQRSDTDSSDASRELVFTTAYTSAPGGAVVLDLADVGQVGSRAVLALRTTLIDPTPGPSN
jgi:hypothetical protein